MSPAPQRSLDTTYRAHLEEGTVPFQQCGQGHAVFPPRPACPRCHDRDLAWVASEGVGTIYSTTTLAPRDQDPYAVVLVDVDEGFRMMSRVDGDDVAAVTIGDRVRLVVRPIGDQVQPCATLMKEALA